MRNWFPITLLALVVAAAQAAAQTGIPAVDSAAAARAAWARGRAALQSADTLAAARELARAAAAWPAQPAYLRGAAAAAAMVDDPAAALRWLNDYAEMGLGLDLKTDKSFARFSAQPEFRDLVRRHAALREPIARSRVRATWPDSSFWPEAVTFAPGSGSFFVTSIRHRTIAEIRHDGSRRTLLGDTPGLGSMLAVRFDGARNALWATTAGLPRVHGRSGDPAIAALLLIDAATGKVQRRYELPAASGARIPGDLAVGPDGDVFITDSGQPLLYHLRAGAEKLTVIRSAWFRSLQGVAVAADGTVYLADYSHGLLELNVGTGAVSALHAPRNVTSLGLDGIVLHDNGIIAIQNGVSPARVVKFHLGADGRTITHVETLDRNAAIADEPTIGTIAGNEFVYVANSQWGKYDADGNRLPDAVLEPPVLLGVRIR